MTMSASIGLVKNEFVATLSDGQKLERNDWREMAKALYEAGVESNAVKFEWHAGQRMMTAGQQVALQSEIRRLGRAAGESQVRHHRLSVAA